MAAKKRDCCSYPHLSLICETSTSTGSPNMQQTALNYNLVFRHETNYLALNSHKPDLKQQIVRIPCWCGGSTEQLVMFFKNISLWCFWWWWWGCFWQTSDRATNGSFTLDGAWENTNTDKKKHKIKLWDKNNVKCDTNPIHLRSTLVHARLSVPVLLAWTKHHSSKQHHRLFHIEHCSTTIATFVPNNTIAEKTATKHNSTISTNSSISTLTENQTPLCSPTFLFMCGPLVALVAWTPHYTQTQQLHIYQRLHFGLGTL